MCALLVQAELDHGLLAGRGGLFRPLHEAKLLEPLLKVLGNPPTAPSGRAEVFRLALTVDSMVRLHLLRDNSNDPVLGMAKLKLARLERTNSGLEFWV